MRKPPRAISIGPPRALLMQFVINERLIVRGHDDWRQSTVHGGPNCSQAHEEVAVTKDRHGQPPTAAQGSRRMDRRAGTRADAAVTVESYVEWIGILAVFAGLAEWQPDRVRDTLTG